MTCICKYTRSKYVNESGRTCCTDNKYSRLKRVEFNKCNNIVIIQGHQVTKLVKTKLEYYYYVNTCTSKF